MRNTTMTIKRSVLSVATLLVMLAAPCLKADDFTTQWDEADAVRMQAAEMGYEWRDTAKILETAKVENEAGNSDLAMALVAQAREQSLDAIAQAERESENWMARVPQ